MVFTAWSACRLTLGRFGRSPTATSPTINVTSGNKCTGGQGSTIFDRALEDYIASLPKDKKQLKFIELCRESDAVSADAINVLIKKEEAKHTLSGPVKRLFDRIVFALKQYNEVIGQLGMYPCIC